MLIAAGNIFPVSLACFNQADSTTLSLVHLIPTIVIIICFYFTPCMTPKSPLKYGAHSLVHSSFMAVARIFPASAAYHNGNTRKKMLMAMVGNSCHCAHSYMFYPNGRNEYAAASLVRSMLQAEIGIFPGNIPTSATKRTSQAASYSFLPL